MIARIDHVQVAAPAGGEDAARAFYGDLLGLPELPKPERLRARGGVWFAVGDAAAARRHRGALRPGAQGAPRARRAARGRPAARSPPRLRGRRAAPITWDGPRFYVEDPFGNRLELLAPHAELRVRALRDDERAWAAAVARLARDRGGSRARRSVIGAAAARSSARAELPGRRPALPTASAPVTGDA